MPRAPAKPKRKIEVEPVMKAYLVCMYSEAASSDEEALLLAEEDGWYFEVAVNADEALNQHVRNQYVRSGSMTTKFLVVEATKVAVCSRERWQIENQLAPKKKEENQYD